jgi:hypothetical protein
MTGEAAHITYRSVLLEIRAYHADAFFWHMPDRKDAAFELHEEA